MDLELRGNAALVTGGNRGIGFAVRASFLTGICITVDGGATRGVYP